MEVPSPPWNGTEQTSRIDVSLDLDDKLLHSSLALGDDDAQAGDVEVKSNALYDHLHRVWEQERVCPELLAYNQDLLDQLQDQLEAQQELIDELETSDEPADSVLAEMAHMDQDRVKFVLSDWLTCRLSKIESHPLHMRTFIDRMSDAECDYLRQYGTILERHMHQSVLHRLPEAWQSLGEDHMIEEPNLEGFYFWQVLEEMEVRKGGDPQEPGTILLAKYSEMKEHLEEGRVELRL